MERSICEGSGHERALQSGDHKFPGATGALSVCGKMVGQETGKVDVGHVLMGLKYPAGGWTFCIELSGE